VIILGDYFGQGWGLNALVNAEYLGIYGMDITPVAENKVTIAYNAAENDSNADAFLEYGAAPLLDPFGTVAEPKTFTLSADDQKNPTWILLTDDSNPDNTIRLTRELMLF